MYRFDKARERWWNKPLVLFDGYPIPAELAILRAELKDNEKGVWMNSRGTKSGVGDVMEIPQQDEKFKLKTIRTVLPLFVSTAIASIYELTGLTKGCPDLVVWDESNLDLRFIEVKCPHWDRPSTEKELFLDEIEYLGLSANIIEWEFVDA
ncbi:MAG: VRR-NUC domain-containing protein [Proteobacteria bacterium]|nr:VRR-NUC domain-containing protein [Pseudomonadota bacterium]